MPYGQHDRIVDEMLAEVRERRRRRRDAVADDDHDYNMRFYRLQAKVDDEQGRNRRESYQKWMTNLRAGSRRGRAEAERLRRARARTGRKRLGELAR